MAFPLKPSHTNNVYLSLGYIPSLNITNEIEVGVLKKVVGLFEGIITLVLLCSHIHKANSWAFHTEHPLHILCAHYPELHIVNGLYLSIHTGIDDHGVFSTFRRYNGSQCRSYNTFHTTSDEK